MKTLALNLIVILITAINPVFGQGYHPKPSHPEFKPVVPRHVRTIIVPAYPCHTRPIMPWEIMALQAEALRARSEAALLSSQAATENEITKAYAIENRRAGVEAYYDIQRQHDSFVAEKKSQKSQTQPYNSVKNSNSRIQETNSLSIRQSLPEGIAWPQVMQSKDLAKQRIVVERFLDDAKKLQPQNVDNSRQTIKATDTLIEELNTHIKEISPGEYVKLRKILVDVRQGALKASDNKTTSDSSANLAQN